jgi:hypothetical protein
MAAFAVRAPGAGRCGARPELRRSRVMAIFMRCTPLGEASRARRALRALELIVKKLLTMPGASPGAAWSDGYVRSPPRWDGFLPSRWMYCLASVPLAFGVRLRGLSTLDG